jgi:hypothetical protein
MNELNEMKRMPALECFDDVFAQTFYALEARSITCLSTTTHEQLRQVAGTRMEAA